MADLTYWDGIAGLPSEETVVGFLKELRPVPWWVEAQWQPQQPQSGRWHLNGQKCAPEIGTRLVPSGNLFQFSNWKMAMEIMKSLIYPAITW